MDHDIHSRRYVGGDAFVRVGAPPWLVSRPLTQGLAATPTVSYEEGPPAVLTDRLLSGRLDCALLPAIDCVRTPRSKVIPGIAVSSQAESRSERLLARVEPQQMRRVAMDIQAGGTVALARIILAECFNAAPEFVPLNLDEIDAASVDGMVLTGEAGLTMANPYTLEYDLGMLWCERSGLPLVQMVWIGQRGASYRELRRVLAFARQRGLDDLDAIAAAAQDSVDLLDVKQYLSDTIRYSMGSLEMDSLRMFIALAAKHGLCEPDAQFTLC